MYGGEKKILFTCHGDHRRNPCSNGLEMLSTRGIGEEGNIGS